MRKFIFIFQLLLVLKVNAASCLFDQNQLQYIGGLEKIKNQNLWKSYPLENRFIMAEAEGDKRGIYILNSNEVELSKSGLPHEICSNSKRVFKIGNNFQIDNFIPHLYCSSIDDGGCSSIPNLSLFQKNTNLNIGIELYAPTQVKSILNKVFQDENIYSSSQIMMYNATHEDFHMYQILRGWLLNSKSKYQWKFGFTIDECNKNNASWTEKYNAEKKIWNENLKNISTMNQEKIQSLLGAIIKIRTAKDEAEEHCWDTLENQERFEGSGHYVGNHALLIAGLAEKNELDKIDLIYLKIKPEIQSVMPVYISGSAFLRLLHQLDPTDNWMSDIEDGWSPYSLLRKKLNI